MSRVCCTSRAGEGRGYVGQKRKLSGNSEVAVSSPLVPLMKLSLVVLLVLSGLLVGPCSAQIEFVGYMTSADGPRFSLKESKAEKASGWLRLGDSYSGFKLLAHDSQKSILSVEKDGNRSELRLKEDRVTHGDAPKSSKPKIGKVKIQFVGATSVSEQVVRDSMQVRPGDEIDEVVIDNSIRSLYRTGRFKQIEIKKESPTPGTVDLEVIVTPK
jgi:hypothetical protein